MGIVNIRDFDSTVWESDKELSSISEFRSLREEYGDERSDYIIKAVYVLKDPSWGKRKYMSNGEILKEADLFFDKAGIDSSDVRTFIDYYEYHCLTDLERELISMEKLVRERGECFHNLSYKNKDESSRKDSMALSHSKFVEELKKMREMVAESTSDSSLRGDYNMSLAEKGFD